MATEIDLACIINVQTNLSRTDLAQRILTFVGGTLQGRHGNQMTTDHNEIEVVKNVDYNKWRIKNQPDGDFLFFQYFVEIFPLDTPLPFEEQVKFAGEVLEFLWSQHFMATAVCDYEHLLPNKGKNKVSYGDSH